MSDLAITVRTLVRATALLALIALVAAVFIAAVNLGEKRRCDWLSDHRATHEYGYTYYCANR